VSDASDTDEATAMARKITTIALAFIPTMVYSTCLDKKQIRHNPILLADFTRV
jgi:hypothetical protein